MSATTSQGAADVCGMCSAGHDRGDGHCERHGKLIGDCQHGICQRCNRPRHPWPIRRPNPRACSPKHWVNCIARTPEDGCAERMMSNRSREP